MNCSILIPHPFEIESDIDWAVFQNIMYGKLCKETYPYIFKKRHTAKWLKLKDILQ